MSSLFAFTFVPKSFHQYLFVVSFALPPFGWVRFLYLVVIARCCRNHCRRPWCCLSIVCSTYWPTTQSECSNTKDVRKLKTHTLLCHGWFSNIGCDVMCDCVCVCVWGFSSDRDSVDESLRDQLNSRLNDVDDFHDDNRCVHFYLHFFFFFFLCECLLLCVYVCVIAFVVFAYYIIRCVGINVGFIWPK